MSTQQENQTAGPEEMVKAALDAVYETVYCPVFFHKLAAHGIHPGTEEEAAELLKMGENLLQQSVEQQVKQAGSRASAYAEINRQLTKTAARQEPGISYDEEMFLSEVMADPQINLASSLLVSASAGR